MSAPPKSTWIVVLLVLLVEVVVLGVVDDDDDDDDVFFMLLFVGIYTFGMYFVFLYPQTSTQSKYFLTNLPRTLFPFPPVPFSVLVFFGVCGGSHPAKSAWRVKCEEIVQEKD